MRPLPCLLLLVALPAWAQGFPDRPIRLVVPFAAGGPTDIPARLFAERMGEFLPNRVVVENRTGAGVVVGTDAVAKAPKDGLTLLYTTVAHAVLRPLFPRLPFDPYADLTPVALVGVIPMVVTVNRDFRARNLQELQARFREARGGLDYASSGNGTALHLAAELLLRRLGVSANHIPYRGTAAAMPDVLNGTIPIIVDVATTALPFVQRGETRALAVMDSRRLPQLPEVPTTAEAGFAGLTAYTWHMVFAPAGTPEPVREALNTALRAAMAQQDVREFVTPIAGQIEASTTAEHARRLGTDSEMARRLVQALGFKADS